MTAALDSRAQMSTAAIDDLPDDAFGYIEPGGTKDATGRTVPRSKRHFPVHDAAHVRNALARMSQSPYGQHAKAKIHKAAKKYGIDMGGADMMAGRSTDDGDYHRDVPDVCTRSYELELRSTGRGGRRLVGTVAVFHKRTRIADRNGDFEEEIQPGFADRSLREHGFPVMQFDHGKDPRVGTVPIGVFEVFGATRTGYDVEGDLFDNAVVEPVRQAIEGRAIKGMSFRFQVNKNGGDRWERRHGHMDLRQVLDADVPEAGPVVFPAYRDTAVSIRSILATFDEDEREELIRELRAQAGLAVDLSDITGRPGARSTGGGENDADTQERSASPATQQQLTTQQRLDDGALRLKGIIRD